MMCIALILILGKAVTGLLLVTQWLTVHSMGTLLRHWSWAQNATLTFATAGDTFVSVSLSYILWRKRVNAAFTR